MQQYKEGLLLQTEFSIVTMRRVQGTLIEMEMKLFEFHCSDLRQGLAKIHLLSIEAQEAVDVHWCISCHLQ